MAQNQAEHTLYSFDLRIAPNLSRLFHCFKCPAEPVRSVCVQSFRGANCYPELPLLATRHADRQPIAAPLFTTQVLWGEGLSILQMNSICDLQRPALESCCIVFHFRMFCVACLAYDVCMISSVGCSMRKEVACGPE